MFQGLEVHSFGIQGLRHRIFNGAACFCEFQKIRTKFPEEESNSCLQLMQQPTW